MSTDKETYDVEVRIIEPRFYIVRVEASDEEQAVSLAADLADETGDMERMDDEYECIHVEGMAVVPVEVNWVDEEEENREKEVA